MSINVGEKIKTLRKALNMTQSELAGSEMTKSMLSQIENNISNPSMKTLHYIATKLNKPISYFLDEDTTYNINQLQYEKETKQGLEDNINYINKLIATHEILKAQEELEKLINNSNSKKLKIYADILLKFADALINLSKMEDAKKYINYSLECYIDGSFYLDASRSYIKLGKVFFNEFNYEESLSICEKAFKFYYKSIIPDSSLEIELYYYKILILSALGHINDTLNCLKTAIKLSTEKSIYYKTDELYRLNGVFCYLIGNKIEYEHSIKKAFEFAKFSENNYCLCSIYIIWAIVELDANNPEKALEHAENLKDYSKNLKDYIEKGKYLYYLIQGRAYYLLGKYELAYENIIKIDFPSHVKHKFDYLDMWYSKIYEGLILNKLGRQAEAIAAMKVGIEKLSIFDKSKFLVNAYKHLSEVYSDMNDFENAFISLKKANEIQDFINNDASIVF